MVHHESEVCYGSGWGSRGKKKLWFQAFDDLLHHGEVERQSLVLLAFAHALGLVATGLTLAWLLRDRPKQGVALPLFNVCV